MIAIYIPDPRKDGTQTDSVLATLSSVPNVAVVSIPSVSCDNAEVQCVRLQQKDRHDLDPVESEYSSVDSPLNTSNFSATLRCASSSEIS